MDAYSKLNHESTLASLPKTSKQRKSKTSKVKAWNKFYGELLKRHKPADYIPEEAEVIEVFKIPTNKKSDGLECTLTQHKQYNPNQTNFEENWCISNYTILEKIAIISQK